MDVLWKDTIIGKLENVTTDMWYLEGTWISNNSALSNDFEEIIKTLKWMEVNSNPSKSTRIQIIEDPENESPTHAVVYELRVGILKVRRVYDRKAIDWLIENVKE